MDRPLLRILGVSAPLSRPIAFAALHNALAPFPLVKTYQPTAGVAARQQSGPPLRRPRSMYSAARYTHNGITRVNNVIR